MIEVLNRNYPLLGECKVYVVACDKCKTNTNLNSIVVGIKIEYFQKYDDEKEKTIRGDVKSMQVVAPDQIEPHVSQFSEACHICMPCKNEIETKKFARLPEVVQVIESKSK